MQPLGEEHLPNQLNSSVADVTLALPVPANFQSILSKKKKPVISNIYK